MDRRYWLMLLSGVMVGNVEAMGSGMDGQKAQRVSKLERQIVRIVNREITRRARSLRVGSADSAVTAASATNAANATTAGRAATAGRSDSSGRSDTSGAADRATTAANASVASFANNAGVSQTSVTSGSANFAGSAEPATYALVRADGTIDLAMSKGITNANVVGTPGFFGGRRLGLYCFLGVSGLKGAAVTARSPEIDPDFEDPTRAPTELTASFTLGTAEFNNGSGPGCPDGTQFGVQVSGNFIPSGSPPPPPGENPSRLTGGINNDFFMILYRLC